MLTDVEALGYMNGEPGSVPKPKLQALRADTVARVAWEAVLAGGHAP